MRVREMIEQLKGFHPDLDLRVEWGSCVYARLNKEVERLKIARLKEDIEKLKASVRALQDEEEESDVMCFKCCDAEGIEHYSACSSCGKDFM